MPGHARLDAPGTLHHVIVWQVERGQIVDDRKNRQNLVSRMGKLASESGTVIYAWTLDKEPRPYRFMQWNRWFVKIHAAFCHWLCHHL